MKQEISLKHITFDVLAGKAGKVACFCPDANRLVAGRELGIKFWNNQGRILIYISVFARFLDRINKR